MVDPLSDCSPLISAASSGKLRLVRLLVEGGAQVNGHNPSGETPLLAACKALRGEPAGPDSLRLLTYLLQNKADPNAQDRAGRTALMYACMERAGAQVASALLAAGADPSMEDHSGASALVYAINAQHQPTLKVLMDACRARGRDIIIIATEMGVNGGPVTRRYLNVPPSPDTSPVSCMSPSDIFLKTGSPNSPEGENIFNFRGTSKRGSSSSSSSRHPSSELSPLSQCSSPSPRQRMLSEPWLAIHNLACLNRAYEEGVRERIPLEEGSRQDLSSEGGRKEDEDEDEGSRLHESRVAQRRDNTHEGENYSSCSEDFSLRASQSVLSLTEMNSAHVKSSILRRCQTPGGSNSDDKLPACPPGHPRLRRNTLPSVTVVPPLLHLPPLDSHLQVPTQASPSRSRRMAFLPHPPSSSPPSRASARPALLPPLSSSVTSLVAPSSSGCSDRSRRSQRRHSAQLEQLTGGALMNAVDL
ncbi:ankyrin repeat domain-containing protein 34B [Stegastes partitus]|uniref:Ankyrin repeat domain-containing protein 34B n=1 Tax=Stegastes partitus TaxID=144197 RepID=A0A9Y4KIA6_9TELE|nr:PREDICTED: ankyrin repeat domain-containing protein 34B-like [Stegastes partitus]